MIHFVMAVVCCLAAALRVRQQGDKAMSASAVTGQAAKSIEIMQVDASDSDVAGSKGAAVNGLLGARARLDAHNQQHGVRSSSWPQRMDKWFTPKELLGSGAFGSVYKATPTSKFQKEHPRITGNMAVKITNDGETNEHACRIAQELSRRDSSLFMNCVSTKDYQAFTFMGKYTLKDFDTMDYGGLTSGGLPSSGRGGMGLPELLHPVAQRKEITVLSPSNIARPCTVIGESENELHIHGTGSLDQWDEWIPRTSDRIFPDPKAHPLTLEEKKRVVAQLVLMQAKMMQEPTILHNDLWSANIVLRDNTAGQVSRGNSLQVGAVDFDSATRCTGPADCFALTGEMKTSAMLQVVATEMIMPLFIRDPWTVHFRNLARDANQDGKLDSDGAPILQVWDEDHTVHYKEYAMSRLMFSMLLDKLPDGRMNFENGTWVDQFLAKVPPAELTSATVPSIVFGSFFQNLPDQEFHFDVSWSHVAKKLDVAPMFWDFFSDYLSVIKLGISSDLSKNMSQAAFNLHLQQQRQQLETLSTHPFFS